MATPLISSGSSIFFLSMNSSFILITCYMIISYSCINTFVSNFRRD
ncbi:MAG: hypothetical protein DRG27_01390 [Deltaproteobacteria bacterium]|nr:MAG: hypothetical protein DRG27_01390 [Deltaproteobacteria bacterium]